GSNIHSQVLEKITKMEFTAGKISIFVHEPNIANISEKSAVEPEAKKIEQVKAVFKIRFKLYIAKAVGNAIVIQGSMSRPKSPQAPTSHAIWSSRVVSLEKRKILASFFIAVLNCERNSYTGKYANYPFPISIDLPYSFKFYVRLYKTIKIFFDKIGFDQTH